MQSNLSHLVKYIMHVNNMSLKSRYPKWIPKHGHAGNDGRAVGMAVGQMCLVLSPGQYNLYKMNIPYGTMPFYLSKGDTA